MDFDGKEDIRRAQPRPPVRQTTPAPQLAPQPRIQPRPTPPAQEVQPVPQRKKAAPKRTFKLPSKKILIVGGASLLVLLVAIVVFITIPTGDHPSYKTVLPKGKSISSLGGWKRVNPPNGDPIYTYVDAIDGVTVQVTQQPLPETLEGSAQQKLESVAKQFYATEKITDTDAYIGTSAKGPQSVLLARGNTLILIKSQREISQKDWANYINSLK